MRQMSVRQPCSIGPHLGQLNNVPRATCDPGRGNSVPRRRVARRAIAAAAAAAVVSAAACLILLIVAALTPTAAAAATVTLAQGTPGHPFDLTAVPAAERMGLAVATQSASGGSDQTLTLDPRVFWSLTATWPVAAGGMGSVQWLSGGAKLVCAGGQVHELNAAGAVVWSYTSTDDPALVTPCWAREFTAGNGHTCVLIADTGARRVFAVDRTDPAKPLVWQYGVSGASGTGVDLLSAPVCAVYVPQGTGGQPTVLITDAGSTTPRVLEVRWADYTAGAANGGFTASSVVWQYGGAAGTGDGQLIWPTDTEREADGSTLIADAGADRHDALYGIQERGR